MTQAIAESRATAPTTTDASIDVADLRRLLEQASDLVLADVSEGPAYVEGHISLAVPVPISELELRLPVLAPRVSVPVVLTSADGTGLDAAATRARSLGYTDVRVLVGGNPAWTAAGFRLIDNFNALSKALGEFVERRYHTPRITVAELKSRIDAGDDIVVMDSRPFEEYYAQSIPTGINAPGVELLRRAYDQVTSPSTQVVVNCAGRTRAILGAQTLLGAGFEHPVLSLENGTGAWTLAGFAPSTGATAVAAEPSAEGEAAAAAGAVRFAEQFGVRRITRGDLDDLRSAADRQTLQIFDVRTAEEFAAGHLADATWVAGGTLVQKTDFHIGSRGAQIVVVDDATGTRARTTAAWLVQLGLPHVSYYLLDSQDPLVTGAPVPPPPDGVRSLGPEQLAAELAGDTPPLVIDLEPESPYVLRRNYLPGSVVSRRSRLEATLASVDADRPIVLTSADGRLALLGAADLADSGRRVLALAGGTNAWEAAGEPTEVGFDQPALDPVSALAPRPTDAERRAYLEWYVAWGDTIVAELEADGLVSFVAAEELR